MDPVYRSTERHELIPATIGKDGRPLSPVVLARTESASTAAE